MRLLVLIIVIVPTILFSRDFKGGELRTIDTYTYGRFEVRMKTPATEGVLASFFTYHEISDLSEWNEIDIEILGRYDNAIQFNSITPYRANHVRSEWVDFIPHNGFHEYAFEWTPEYVAWFIDGKEVFRQSDSFISTLNLPQKIMMNIWNPVYDNWVGEWNPKILPVFAYYDWVKYAAYSPGNGNIGTDNNFTTQWVDDFESWDQSRWQKASHTFEGNNCDFISENVVFKDGNMILCLTTDTDTGYVDKNPPFVLWAHGMEDQIIVKFSEQIDSTSAVKIASYQISGIPIHSAILKSDGRTVLLTTGSLDYEALYNLVVLGIKDLAENPNTLYGQVVPVNQEIIKSFPLKINLGGDEFMGYMAAQNWQSETSHGYMDGIDIQWPANINIQNTDDDYIYLTARKALVRYNVKLTNGTYEIKFKFAENHFDSERNRIFDVYIEGNKVISALDIFKQVGKNNAYDVVIDNVVVTDRQFDIHFASVLGETIVNAIEISQDPSGIESSTDHSVEGYWIAQNYPNPFNSGTTFEINLQESGNIRLEVFDARGTRITTLLDGWHASGNFRYNYEFEWASGIYFYKFDIKNKNKSYNQVKKMILIK